VLWDALVKAVILAAEVLKEGDHDVVLEKRSRKVGREAATGDLCGYLWVAAGSADASDPGTCKRVGGVVSYLCQCCVLFFSQRENDTRTG
jgi:hypothetical protein